MRLEGIHHVTAVTADAQGVVDLYAGVLGLRLVKRTVDFDAPEMYHLYLGDEAGAPGSLLTFFEVPGARAGRPGTGAVHRILWRVADEASPAWWQERLGGVGIPSERVGDGLRFDDPEGLGHELVPDDGGDPPLRAASPAVPPEHALRGIAGVRAFARSPRLSRDLLAGVLGFEPEATEDGDAYRVAGDGRHARYLLDPAPDGGPVPGPGTVHHVAWAVRDEDQEAWRLRLVQAGERPTPVLDRDCFRSIYFREPSGVLFELATLGPGFAVDEPADRLGETLRLPARLAALRPPLERRLTPLVLPPRPGRAPAATGAATTDGGGT